MSKEPTPIEELLEAIKIFLKYDEGQYPINADHDIIYFYVDPNKVCESDHIRLEELGFDVHQEFDCYYSYKYGSC